MTILISSSCMDSTTDHVMDWIYSIEKDAKIIRINDDQDYSLSFEYNDIAITYGDNQKVFLNQIDSFWYRRGRIRYHFDGNTSFADLREEETKVLEEYVHYKLAQKRTINDYFHSNVNKLIVLEEAQKAGLAIPETYLLENKKDVTKALASSALITKNYLAAAGFDFDDCSGVIFTVAVQEDDMAHDTFSPSLFQHNIEKKIEIRSFYFRGKIWSMAIFSQDTEETKTDFRIYNKVNPNKNIPFQLPTDIAQKVDRLMKKINLDCGSIDFILTKNNEYVFLEVNPVGQFGMVSSPCNYNIEKEIAKYLCYED
ncbi:grasp-with-spasm system ATP-grasp peptide maturase [Flavobacterium sp.]|uniref:grasp-with-spasm system ATP-grasp peptide maturase n=1 Tax=Flavobacterium sp. TaxID=239 RepID=UPI0039E384A0